MFVENHQFLFNKFIYVLGLKNEFRYFVKPQPTKISLLGNGNINEYPFHPTLAHDLKLDVSLAGEISFLWNKDENNPKIIFINNVSGHYKPYKWDCRSLNGIIREVLNLTEETVLISLANDGVAISGNELKIERQLQ